VRRFKVQRARQALDEPAPDGIGSDNARLPGRPATFTDQDASAEDKTVGSVYLTSGAGAAAENARSNAARSAPGKSETATKVKSPSLQLRT